MRFNRIIKLTPSCVRLGEPNSRPMGTAFDQSIDVSV